MRRTNGALSPGAQTRVPTGPLSCGARRRVHARGLTRQPASHTSRAVLDVKPKPRAQTPPAKRWRNYYRVYHVLTLARLGTIFPGIHAGPDAFPSKEIAEQHAKELLAMLNPPGRWLMDHAGAFPEGDAAN